MSDDQPNNQAYNMGDVRAENGEINVGGTVTKYINSTVYINAKDDSVQHRRPGATSATLYTNSRAVMGLPDDDAYFGYVDERATVQGALDANGHVLITGFGGAGKTTLAAHLTAKWLDDGRGKVLYLYLGSNDAENTLGAIAAAFDAERQVNQVDLNARFALLRQFIIDEDVTLLVFDDAWDADGLRAALQAVPNRTPVMVTSRQQYGHAFRETVALSQLAPDAALELLSHHARGQDTSEGAALCERLAYLPYAVRLAGKRMTADEQSATEMLATFKAAHTLRVPHDFGEDPGRLSLAMLIEHSLNVLDADSAATFRALGAFFEARVTPELLTHYFAAREQTIDPAATLEKLHFHGLVTRVKGDAENVTSYRVHDLAYEYATAGADEAARGHALAACLATMKAHYSPSIENFNALMPLMNHFEAAQAWALATERWTTVEQFGWDLYANAGNKSSEIIQYRGLWARGITLLGHAAEAAERRGSQQAQSAHLNHRAVCQQSIARYDDALADYERALAIKEEIGDKLGKAIALGNMGNVYLLQKRYDAARATYERALAISRELENKREIAKNLGNLAGIETNQGDYERAVDGYREAIALYRELEDEQKAALHLGNLGNCYRKMRRHDDALAALTEALATNTRLGNTNSIGYNHEHLGYLYEYGLDDLDKALEHYEQCLAIRRKQGNPSLIKWTEDAIARVRGKLGGAS